MFQEDLLDRIMDLPDAPNLIREVTVKLNDETQRRHKFYNDIDEQMKVEFINGEIVMHSPVRREHNEATGLLYQLINVHVHKNKLGFVGFEKIMSKFTRNDYEPDIVFFNTEKSKSFTKKQVLFPVPDFIVEVLSDGTKEKDRGVKFTDYENHKVREYWIIDAEKEVIEQYLIVNGQYELNLKSSNGIIKSQVIEGFEIPIKAIFDETLNLEAMQNLLQ
ncbi:MAG: Uma2 family endonuclease [Emticicia sp.]|nr:Uma2 family endonuclease [Emticicia sp.]